VSSLASAHAMMDRKKHCAFGFTPLSCNQKFRVNQLQIDDASSEGRMDGARRAPCWQGCGLRRHAPCFDALLTHQTLRPLQFRLFSTFASRCCGGPPRQHQYAFMQHYCDCSASIENLPKVAGKGTCGSGQAPASRQSATLP